MRTWPGRPYPLGATWDGGGVNFSIFSEHATKVELCLFDSPPAIPRYKMAIYLFSQDDTFPLQGRSTAVFRLVTAEESET